MKLKIDWQHIVIGITGALGLFGAQLLPAGSLATWGGNLGPWLGLVSMILALLKESILTNNPTKPSAPTAAVSALMICIAVLFTITFPWMPSEPALQTGCSPGAVGQALKTGADTLDLLNCIEAQPQGQSPLVTAGICKAKGEQEVIDILAWADRRAARRFTCVSQDAGR
jgi:hypothetical protein